MKGIRNSYYVDKYINFHFIYLFIFYFILTSILKNSYLFGSTGLVAAHRITDLLYGKLDL